MRALVYAGSTVVALGFGLAAIGANSPEAERPQAPAATESPIDSVSEYMAGAGTTSSESGIAAESVETGSSAPRALQETPAPPAPANETPSVTRDDEDDREARRRRWRERRNRFPAPSFTPDEWRPPEGPIRIALQAGHWKSLNSMMVMGAR